MGWLRCGLRVACWSAEWGRFDGSNKSLNKSPEEAAPSTEQKERNGT